MELPSALLQGRERNTDGLGLPKGGFPGSEVAVVFVFINAQLGKCHGKAKLTLLSWKSKANPYT